MKKISIEEYEKTRLTYEEAIIEIVTFDCDTDILTTSSPMDENQGEWDPQL